MPERISVWSTQRLGFGKEIAIGSTQLMAQLYTGTSTVPLCGTYLPLVDLTSPCLISSVEDYGCYDHSSS
jgi:hypothetical protein